MAKAAGWRSDQSSIAAEAIGEGDEREEMEEGVGCERADVWLDFQHHLKTTEQGKKSQKHDACQASELC